MTIAQIKGMLRMHKAHYKAYKAINSPKAQDARLRMLEMYLLLRASR
jgi:hypothetical protein